MLKITNLKAGYGGMEILKGMDFEAKAGQITAIIGPNGAGKSTLLKSIFNLTEIYSGKIIFKDKDITCLPTYQLIALGLSFVPQGRQVFSGLTVLENLEMGVFVFKNKELIKRNIAAVFEKLPVLKEKKNELASNLSGGQQQMLSLGRALIQDPELLLLDEPSLGLSPKICQEIFTKIEEIKKSGFAVIIVEQNVKQAINIADKTYVLESGKIALSGGKEILQNEKIKSIYLGG